MEPTFISYFELPDTFLKRPGRVCQYLFDILLRMELKSDCNIFSSEAGLHQKLRGPFDYFFRKKFPWFFEFTIGFGQSYSESILDIEIYFSNFKAMDHALITGDVTFSALLVKYGLSEVKIDTYQDIKPKEEIFPITNRQRRFFRRSRLFSDSSSLPLFGITNSRTPGGSYSEEHIAEFTKAKMEIFSFV